MHQFLGHLGPARHQIGEAPQPVPVAVVGGLEPAVVAGRWTRVGLGLDLHPHTQE
jgi:hypothetical protein